MRSKLIFLSVLMHLSSLGIAHAQVPVDGIVSLTCAPSEVVSCVRGKPCRSGHPREFNVPKLVTFRFSEGQLELIYGSDVRTPKLGEVVNTQRQLIVQSVLEEVAWTLTVNKKSRQLVVAGMEPNYRYFLTGTCGEADEDRPVSREEQTAIQRVLKAQGCTGGRMGFDTDDGYYEVINARCRDQQVSFKLDRSFQIISKNVKD